MGKILKLSNDVIGMIAAGEVVERPAAAIKELVENSLDAGATGVTVEIRDGGLQFIRVTDNGSGISPEDLVMAFERHATSKLKTAEQLSQVETLGFRGEALASIAAVSRVTLLTRQRGSETGMKAENEGGEMRGVGEAACAEGTSITVRDLFFNAPVRRKFMKKPQQETAQAAELMRLMILSHPEVSFRLKADGKPVFFSAGDGTADAAFMSIYGLAALKMMKKADMTMNGVVVEGLVGVGDNARGNRSHQSFFINGRAMRSALLSQAVEEACRQRVMIGRFPLCCLYLTMPNHLVDVNVHPNKWEVRFSDEKGVREAVFEAVRAALSEGAAAQMPPPLFLDGDKKAPPADIVKTPADWQKAPEAAAEQKEIEPFKAEPFAPPQTLYVRDPAWRMPAAFTEPIAPPAPPPPAPSFAPASFAPEIAKAEQVADEKVLTPSKARVIGAAFNTYIIFEHEDTLILCDQHALHERLLFERYRKAYDTGAAAQMLLAPRAVHLSYREYGTFLEHQAYLASVGYDAEDFGEQTVRLHSVPLILGEPEAERGFREALDVLEASGGRDEDKTFDRLLQSACKHAIKGGDKRPQAELEALINDMLTRDVIPTCPHGRPLMVSIGKRELEKRFGRIQL